MDVVFHKPRLPRQPAPHGIESEVCKLAAVKRPFVLLPPPGGRAFLRPAGEISEACAR